MDRLMQIGLQLAETNYTFSVDTTHAQGHSTFTQQVMQMLLVQANSYNFSEGGTKKKTWLTRPASGKFDRVSGMP